MKKTILNIFIFICMLFVLIACNKTKNYELDSSNFNPVVEYNGEIDLEELTIVVDGNDKVAITKEMVSGIDTSSVGNKTLSIDYQGHIFEVDYVVKYKLTFMIDNVVYETKFVIDSVSELNDFKEPSKENDSFVGWKLDLNFNEYFDLKKDKANDNLQLYGVFLNSITPITPELNIKYNAIYGDTLGEIELPSNEYGKWEFKDPLTTTVGNVGENEFEVIFKPLDDNLVSLESKIIISVEKRELILSVDNENFIYNGNEQYPSLVLPNDINANYIYKGEKGKYVGEYIYSYIIDDPNYSGVISGKYKIDKAVVEITPTINNTTIKYGPNLVVEDPTFNYSKGEVYENDELNIKFIKPQVVSVGTYNYEFSYDNPNYDVTFKPLTLVVNKGDLANFPEPNIVGDVYYGDKLSDLEFASSTLGSFEFVLNEVITSVGQVEYEVIFTPIDSINYNQIKSNIILNILKRKIDIEILENVFIYDGKEHNLSYKLNNVILGDDIKIDIIGITKSVNVIDSNVTLTINSNYYVGTKNVVFSIEKRKVQLSASDVMIDYYKDFEIPTPIYETYNLIDGDVLNYSLIKPNATSAGEYQYQVVLGENPNYEVEVAPCKLIVNKVNYPIEEIEDAQYPNLKLTYGDILNDEMLVGTSYIGEFNLVNNNLLVDDMNITINFIFTPYDKNYLPTEVSKNYVVNKKVLKIEIINDEFVYDGKNKTVAVKVAEESLVSGNNNYLFVGTNNYVNVGNYNFTISLLSDYYEGEIDVQLKILPKTLIITKLETKEIKFGYNPPIIDLSDLEVNGIVDGEDINEILKIKNLTKEEILNIGNYNYEVEVVNSNYKVLDSIICTLNVQKGEYPYDVVIPNIENAVYGMKYSELEYEKENEYGSFNLEEQELDKIVTNIHNNKIKFIFTPNDENYLSIIVEGTFDANKKELDINLINNNFTYGEEIVLEFIVDGLVLGDIEPNINYIVLDNKLLENAGAYQVEAKVDDLNYSGTKTFEIIINKAIPNYELPTINAYYNQKLSDIVLTNGFIFTNSNKNIDKIGIYETTLTYIPDDLINYEKIYNIPININVSKAETEIILNKDNLIYYAGNDNLSLLEKDLNNIIITNRIDNSSYSYDVVDDLSMAGTYYITIKYLENEYYLEKDIILEIIVRNTPENLTATYGDMLHSINLPKDEDGIWSFIKEDYQILEVGEIEENVIYNGLNGESYELKVIIEVLRKEVYINISNNELIYNGETQSLTYTITGAINENDNLALIEKVIVDGTVSAKNVGNYSGILKIDEVNYYANSTKATLIIKEKEIKTTMPIVEIVYNEAIPELDFSSINELAYLNDDLGLSYNTNYIIGSVVGEYILNITSTNKNYLVTINNNNEVILKVNKANPNITNIKVNNALYGDIYSNLINDITYDGIAGNIILVEDGVVLNPTEKNIINVIFKPIDNINYNEIELEIEFYGNKREAIINLGEEDYEFDYDGTQKILKSSIVTGLLTSDSNKNVEVIVSIESKNYGYTDFINADSYTISYIINDECYYGSISYEAIINKRQIRVEYKTVGRVTFSINLVDDDIPNANKSVIELYDENDIISGDIVDYIITKPTAQKVIEYGLYNSSSNFYRAYDVKLTNPNYYIFYVSSSGRDYDERGLYLTISKGDYEADFGLPELPYVENTSDLIYGDRADKIILANTKSDHGEWEILEIDYQPYINEKKVQVYFQPIGCYYASDYIYIDISFNKRKLSLKNIQNTFTYTGEEISVTYDLEGNYIGDFYYNDMWGGSYENDFVDDGWSTTYEYNYFDDETTVDLDGNLKIKIIGNVKKIDQGSYPVTFSLESDYYELTQEYKTTLIIEKSTISINLDEFILNENNNNQTMTAYFDKSIFIDGVYKLSYKPNVKDIPIKVSINGEIQEPIIGDKEFDITEGGIYTFNFSYEGNNNIDSFNCTFILNFYVAEVSTSQTLKSGTGVGYASLDDAILAANKIVSGKVYIYIYNDVNITKNVIINDNVELYIPHETKTTYEEYTKDSALIGVNDIVSQDKQKCLFTVTIDEFVEVSLNGTIAIGADRSGTESNNDTQGDIAQNYSQIINNGTITINNGGKIVSLGYIKGNGNITINFGGALYEPFVMLNWRGGQNAYQVYTSGIVPFTEYKIHNVLNNITIKYGANYVGMAAIHTGSAETSQWNTAIYSIIGSGALLEILDEDSYIIKKTKEKQGSTFELYGHIKDNPGNLEIEGVELGTTGLLFAINYNIEIIVKANAQFDTYEDYKLLPGAIIKVEEGAVLNIYGRVAIYKDFEDKGYGSSGDHAYPNIYDDGKLVVEGTINVTGILAGNITLTEGYNAIVNLIDAAELMLTVKEGWGTYEQFNQTYEATYYANYNGVNLEKSKYQQVGIELIKC